MTINQLPPQTSLMQPTGWVCPKCQAVMGPCTPMCFYCKPRELINSNSDKCDEIGKIEEKIREVRDKFYEAIEIIDR